MYNYAEAGTGQTNVTFRGSQNSVYANRVQIKFYQTQALIISSADLVILIMRRLQQMIHLLLMELIIQLIAQMICVIQKYYIHIMQ